MHSLVQVCSNVLRGTIAAPVGRKIVAADESQIEARGLCWLSGESWKVKAFAEGREIYKATASGLLGKPADQITKEERQSYGKVPELALGYGGGVGAFVSMAAAYRLDLDDVAVKARAALAPEHLEAATRYWETAKRERRDLGLSEEVFIACDAIKRAWRSVHPATVRLWYDLENACRQARTNEGTVIPVGKWLKVHYAKQWLRIRLPSGRSLCYPFARIDDAGRLKFRDVDAYAGAWRETQTYGGKLCIAAGTLVLTHSGWKPIEQVTEADRVWDGVEWVRCDGSVFNGTRDVVRAYGALMTPDHEVLTESGWRVASSCEGHNRAACRLPVGVSVPEQRRAPVDHVQGAGQQSEVFDVVNCGPRARFVIAAGGAPLIVHNCENVTQAVARDVLGWNMLEAEASGYPAVLSVHDELVTLPEDNPAYTAEGLCKIIATVPPWAPGLPLAADGFEARRYKKA